jgi:cell division protein FtsW
VADRTVARRRPKATVAGGSHLRLIRTEDLTRAVPTPVAVTRRNLALLLVPTALLTVIGLVMILSAGSISAVEGYDTAFWYFNRQTLYAAAGLVGLVVTARVPYAFWRRAAIPMLLAVLPVMLLTLHPAFGSSLYGAARWIDLGPITLQPAEFAKFLTVCAAAAILSRPWKDLTRPRDVFLPLGPLVLVIAGVVLLQRDLGTTLIICGSVFLILFASGVRVRYLAWTGLGAVAATAWFIWRTEYRRTRFLEAWLNWELDPSGAGWQLRQGLIALGSGGWLGIGLGNSRQKWDYLPNAHSDFVFAILGEELGLIGALAVLSLFGTLLFAGIRIAVRASDTFGRLLAAGITGWIGLQTLVNLGAVTGLLPITGVPLPFLSFGGTALVVTLAGVGVMASIALDGVRSAERSHIHDRRRHGGEGRRR